MILDFDELVNEAYSQVQRSPQWLDVRLGRFTSSEIWRLMSTPRGGKPEDLSDTAITYIESKVAEVLTGQSDISFGAAIEWGVDHEEAAKNKFEERNNIKIEPAGFVKYGDHAGGSPDGYVNGATLEIKCPYYSNHHVAYAQLTNAKSLYDVDSQHKYYYQVQSQILFCGADYGLFVSYDPRMKNEKNQLAKVMIEPVQETFDLIKIKLESAIKLKLQLLNQFN